MTFVMDLLYLLAAIIISPIAAYRILRHDRYRRGWANRFGNFKRKNPEKKCLWIHAVSLGEVNATKTIITEFKKTFPQFEIVMTTTTDTGFDRATSLFGNDLDVFFFPFDFSLTMTRAFANIKPTLCLLMELEVWPNFINIAKRSNTPVVVVNGRISDNSFSKYKAIKPITKAIFKNITLILAQTQQYAQRFEQIGAKNVIVTGSLKYDTAQITDTVEGADTLAAELGIKNEKLLIAGGTGNDEEKIILETYKNLSPQFNDLRLVIVPRKPERFDEVAQLIKQANLPLTRYSQIKNGSVPPTDNKTVILGDTMGDLRKFYSLATIIFVGRSLVPMGGSDMAEAAALGKCTIFGPHATNFKQTVDALLAANGAILANDANHLKKIIEECLTNPDYANTIAQNGQKTIKQNQGATAKTIDHLKKLLT